MCELGKEQLSVGRHLVCHSWSLSASIDQSKAGCGLEFRDLGRQDALRHAESSGRLGEIAINRDLTETLQALSSCLSLKSVAQRPRRWFITGEGQRVASTATLPKGDVHGPRSPGQIGRGHAKFRGDVWE
jgi:hypothetical protein